MKAVQAQSSVSFASDEPLAAQFGAEFHAELRRDAQRRRN